MSKAVQQVETRTVVDQVIKAISEAVGQVPATTETLAQDPVKRASSVIIMAASKSAAVSAGLSLPPGPLGLVTIIPDLLVIWKLQQQMVADIAGAFGKQAALSQEQMLYCLFRHAASQAVRDLVVRVGERVLIKKASLKAMQAILEKVGIKVSQRVLGKGISRWLPVVGAVAVGAYAFYDTHQVGKTAVELFSQDVSLEVGPPTNPGASLVRDERRSGRR